MAKAFSLQGEVQLDTQSAKADLASLEKTQTKIPIAIDAREARRQADAMLALVERMDRKVARPRVDAASIKQAKDAVTSLDKAWEKMARSRATRMRDVAGSFALGQNILGGGLSGAIFGATELAATSGTALTAGMAGFGVAGAGAAAFGAFKLAKMADDSQRLEKFLGKAYAQGGGASFAEAAKNLQEQTGFLADDFMRAALIGKTLVNNYGLQIDQVKKLVEVSADLAATSPYEDVQTVSNAMERVQSAIRGEAEASERLGLTLNDTYMKNIAFGGSLKTTWEKLSEAEKAQYRYMEVLNQTKDILGAAEKDEGLNAQLRAAKAELAEIGKTLGKELAPALADILKAVSDFINSIPQWFWELIGRTARVASGREPAAGAGSLPYVTATTIAKYRGAEELGYKFRQVMGKETLVDAFGNVVDAMIETEKATTKKAKPWWVPTLTPMIIGGGTKIVVEDRTIAGIRVQDARSFAPSNV